MLADDSLFWFLLSAFVTLIVLRFVFFLGRMEGCYNCKKRFNNNDQ